MHVCPIQRHRRNLKMDETDPRRCDNATTMISRQSSDSCDDFSIEDMSMDDFSMDEILSPPPLTDITTADIATANRPPDGMAIPLPPADLTDIVRRRSITGKHRLCVSVRPTVRPRRPITRFHRDINSLQDQWAAYVRQVHAKFSLQFWSFFLPLHAFAGVVINAALDAATKAFPIGRRPGRADQDKPFPKNNRQMKAAMSKIPSFWPLVTCTQTIHLNEYDDLPPRLRQFTFRFIDPVWAWVTAAQRQPPADMQWIPKRAVRPDDPHDYYYGGGVQFGDSFAQAFSTCPVGTYPMLVECSWDGAHGHGLHATPICIGVGNTNSCSADTKFCISYLPVLSDLGAAVDATEITHVIRQKCIAAVLRVLERAAVTGVKCRLPSIGGGTAEMNLFPRLCSMNLDSPEARVYFGLQNKCSCSKCIRRKGRSAFRVGQVLHGSDISSLYGIIQYCEDDTLARMASQKLMRSGFSPVKRCLLPLVCDKLLIRRPGHEDEVFPAVDFRDRLHALIIFIHRQLLHTFVEMRLPQAVRDVLDRRLAELGTSRSFHHTQSGKSMRVQRSLFSEAHMSAADRVTVMTLLPQVLGHEALDLPAELREPTLTAVAYAHIFMLAVHDLRPYNIRELREIFTRGWVIFFGALETIHARNHERIFAKRMKSYRKNPNENPVPKRFKQANRYLYNHHI